MTKDEALKLALEALENISTALREEDVLGSDIELMLNAITAIKKALALEVQEPINYEDWLYNPMTGEPIWGDLSARSPLPEQESGDRALAKPELYDQTALELCEVCGWKTLIPSDGCLNCERKERQAHC